MYMYMLTYYPYMINSVIQPVFLRRSLTYMLKKKPSRKGFSVDSLLEMKENKMKAGNKQVARFVLILDMIALGIITLKDQVI